MRKAMANPCIGSLLSVLRISISSVPWSMSTLVMSRCPFDESLMDKRRSGVWLGSLRMSRGEKVGSTISNAKNGYLGQYCKQYRDYNCRKAFHRGSRLVGRRAPWTIARLSSAADRIQPALRPYQQAFSHQRRRRLRHVIQFIHVQ